MNNNLIWLLQSATIEQVKKELDKKIFIDKKLKDYEKGIETIDNLTEFRNMSIDVQYALLLYSIYKIKGGK